MTAMQWGGWIKLYLGDRPTIEQVLKHALSSLPVEVLSESPHQAELKVNVRQDGSDEDFITWKLRYNTSEGGTV